VGPGHDVRAEIRQFLMTRRARITPEQAGLPNYGGRRRVPGLRREELALLAGISEQYLVRLERGNVRGVSDDVIGSIARALHLDEVERAHLIDLIRLANTPRTRQQPGKSSPSKIRPSVRQILDSMTGAAAFARNARLDVLATNHLGRGLYAPVLDNPDIAANLVRFVFLDPSATQFYRDWEGIAHDAVGSLRTEAGRTPGDRRLSALIGDLSIRSEQFRTRWAAHDVRYYRSGVQPFNHPLVGNLDLDYDALELPTDPGLTIVAYTAAPGSEAAKTLTLLGEWTGVATPNRQHSAGVDTGTHH
jgi:transcriptional regulator with XRE-family HTH domain